MRTAAELASELRVTLARLGRRLARERPSSHEVSMTAMSVLGLLERRGDLTVGEIAASEQVKPPSITRTLACLERGGHIGRHRNEADGRQVIVRLSERGRRAVLADRAWRDEWLAGQMRALTPGEREILRCATPLLELLARQA